MYIYHYKFTVIKLLYFSAPYVYPSRKCICINKHIYKKAVLYHCPGLPKYTFWVFPSWLSVSWMSKTLHYISRREETTLDNKMDLDKVPNHSWGRRGSHLLNNPQAMCRQLSVQDTHQSDNTETAEQSLSTGYGWCSLDGDRWSELAGLPWESLLSETGSI